MEDNKKEPCGNNVLSKRDAYFIAIDIITINTLINSIHYITNDILFYLGLFLLVLSYGLFLFNALTAS